MCVGHTILVPDRLANGAADLFDRVVLDHSLGQVIVQPERHRQRLRNDRKLRVMGEVSPTC